MKGNGNNQINGVRPTGPGGQHKFSQGRSQPKIAFILELLYNFGQRHFIKGGRSHLPERYRVLATGIAFANSRALGTAAFGTNRLH
jgi:hypothetical protein